MTNTTENKTEGWAVSSNSNARSKWHYYRNLRSLCGRYTLIFRTAPYEQGNNNSPDNCPKCREKLLKELNKEESS